jgi:hypothetical protein
VFGLVFPFHRTRYRKPSFHARREQTFVVEENDDVAVCRTGANLTELLVTEAGRRVDHFDVWEEEFEPATLADATSCDHDELCAGLVAAWSQTAERVFQFAYDASPSHHDGRRGTGPLMQLSIA